VDVTDSDKHYILLRYKKITAALE